MNNQKQLFMIGGPNGAGKTTSAFVLMPELIQCQEYVNADAIAASLSPFNPDVIAIKSGKIMLSRIKELIQLERSFAFETTMASRSFGALLKKCKNLGYQINLLYIWLASFELAIERVQHRVLAGGHFIPPEVIRRRYFRSAHNFKNIYIPLADRWILCDNSTPSPLVIAQKYKRSNDAEIHQQDLWESFNEA